MELVLGPAWPSGLLVFKSHCREIKFESLIWGEGGLQCHSRVPSVCDSVSIALPAPRGVGQGPLASLAADEIPLTTLTDPVRRRRGAQRGSRSWRQAPVCTRGRDPPGTVPGGEFDLRLSNGNAGVLRRTQGGQKPPVEQNSKSS